MDIQWSCRLCFFTSQKNTWLGGRLSNHAIFGTQDCVAGTIGLYDMDSHPCVQPTLFLLDDDGVPPFSQTNTTRQ